MGIQTVSQALSNENGGSSPFGFKNRIINGAMVIDQRNAGASITPADGGFSVDRWRCGLSQASKFTTQQQTSVVPVGFSHALKVTSSSSYSVLSTDEFEVMQRVEGYNFADMNWGTANAKTITLSFWVNSSLTGTFGGILTNNDGSRVYPFSYTINNANTWEYETIIIAGDTTGTWNTTTGTAVSVFFSLGAGSSLVGTAGAWSSTGYRGVTGQVNLVSNSGATWHITGVQLEKAPQATAFDYRDYGRELAMCQRYFYKVDGTDGLSSVGAGMSISTTEGRIAVQYPVKMRASPTASIAGTMYLLNTTGAGTTVTSLAANYGGAQGAMIGFGVASGMTVGAGNLLITNTGASNYFQASAEL
jgi:hypothetical protein